MYKSACDLKQCLKQPCFQTSVTAETFIYISVYISSIDSDSYHQPIICVHVCRFIDLIITVCCHY